MNRSRIGMVSKGGDMTNSNEKTANNTPAGPGRDGLLPAPQIKESHDLQLDPDAIDGSMTIAVVPYGGMANGDVVRLLWVGTRADGNPGPTVNLPIKTLSDSDTDPSNNPGSVLNWSVLKTNAVAVRGGSISLHYEITHAAPGTQVDSESAQRIIQVIPPSAPELAAPTIKDLTGSVINPGQFPEGIRVVVTPYPGIRAGDDLLVYGTRTGLGSGPNKNTIQYLKIDQAMIDSGRIEVPIPVQWLLDNQGGSVSVRYQYGRDDAAGSGVPLALTIREPLVLPTPTVDNSVVTEGRDELNPIQAISGAYITIPSAATIGDDDVVIAHWKGFGTSGSYDAQEAEPSNPLKFKVPSTVLPPNFGKTVEVTYSVSGQEAQPPLQLYIRELASHPDITCEGAQVGSPATLKLSDIPPGGALLSLSRWSFISTEQTVRLWLTASSVTERDIIPLRPVLPAETSTGVTARLMTTHLTGIAANSVFTLRASVSFDGGHSTVVFKNPLQLKLLD
ncbi:MULTISPECIES: hypothetical protein [Pseudomonas]|jgi:hypothetical protein|uniref:IPT/TIG domain-containing protein n=1 Tax=Pseudomonas beijingensis TaxID=2954101 RepID=A0ABY9F8K9_9PSED|nr:hypothetical protein [Pseudomonas sp. FP2034]WLG99815.1 hypothetical protein PSH92_20980 [Pseudomonas sp. FP2034]